MLRCLILINAGCVTSEEEAVETEAATGTGEAVAEDIFSSNDFVAEIKNEIREKKIV